MLASFRWEVVLIYLNETDIFSKTVKEHMENERQAFPLLRIASVALLLKRKTTFTSQKGLFEVSKIILESATPLQIFKEQWESYLHLSTGSWLLSIWTKSVYFWRPPKNTRIINIRQAFQLLENASKVLMLKRVLFLPRGSLIWVTSFDLADGKWKTQQQPPYKSWKREPTRRSFYLSLVDAISSTVSFPALVKSRIAPTKNFANMNQQ